MNTRYLPLIFVGLFLAAASYFAIVSLAESPEEEPAAKSSDEPFELGDMIEDKDFEPPPLEELIAEHEWTDREIDDGIDRLRARQAQEPPLATVAEALDMQNNSEEDNAMILSAMGRLWEDPSDIEPHANIRRHTGADVKSTNPLMVSSTAEFEVVELMGISLIEFDQDFEVYGSEAVVESWRTSTDGLVDIFVLRDDLFWSDEEKTPVTAHDFVFGWQVTLSSQVPVTSRTSAEQLQWVEAYDDRTLVIFHKKALATNHWNCGLTCIPKHIYEDTIADDPTMQNSELHVKYEQNPVVAGPYYLAKRVQGTEVVLKAREDYYMQDGVQVRRRPPFEAVYFRTIPDPNTSILALKSGEIDEMTLNAEQWISQTNDERFYENNTKVRNTEWTAYHFCWNNESRFFNDPRVRWAMTYAFDHEEMLESLFFDLYSPCTGVFHPDSRWAPDDPPAPITQDYDRAEELLEAAGWTDTDGDGILDKDIDGRRTPFKFSILTSQSPNSIAICSLLKQSLWDIGIQCDISVTEFTVLQQKTRDHAFDACMGGWGTGADPYTLENIFGTDEDRNFGQYSNPEVDELFEAGMAELDPEKREEIYQELHMKLWEDQPYTWLFNPSSFHAFDKDLRGYVFSPRGPFNYNPGFFSIWTPDAP